MEVRAAREDFDGKTTIGKFAIAQMLNIAELESNQKSDSWKDTIERRRRAGLAHGSRGRFGYFRCDVCPPPERGKTLLTCPRCKDGILKIDPVTGPILASLYRRYAAGESVRGMVLWLKEQGVKHYTGTDIDAGALYHILDSGFGLGFVRFHRQLGRDQAELVEAVLPGPDGGPAAVPADHCPVDPLRLRLTVLTPLRSQVHSGTPQRSAQTRQSVSLSQ
ncbi:recombinase family protein [Streptomyces sp. NPDC002523]